MSNQKSLILKLIAACIASCAGLFVFYPIADGDIFWHLAAGREMVHRKAFLFADPFSFTTPGIEWIDCHWLFQLISFALYSCCGYYGLLIIKSIVIACAIFILISPIKSYMSASIIALVVLFALFQCRYLIPLRPGIYTLLYMVLFIRYCEKFSVTNQFRNVCVLALIQIAWVNTQGLFLIGPAIYCCYFIGALTNGFFKKHFYNGDQSIIISRKIPYLYSAGFLLITVSSLINPYGLKCLLFPLKLFSRITPGEKNVFSNVIDENMPMLNMIGTEYHYYVVTFLILCVAALALSLFAVRKVKSTHVYLVLCFAVLAFMAQRNLILFVVALIPLIKHTSESIDFLKKRNVRKVIGAGLVFCSGVFVLIAGSAHIAVLRSVNGPVAPFCHPVKSTEYIKDNKLQGNIFNADRYGGYLIWNTYPPNKVFIDTRLSMRDRKFFINYLAILDSRESFETMVKTWDISAVLIPGALARYFNLVRYLYYSDEWVVAVADGSECLFVKKDHVQGPVMNLNDREFLNSYLKNIRNDPMLNSSAVKDEAGARFMKFIGGLTY